MNSVSSTLPSAPLWRRLAAMVYDSFLILAILILIGFINLGLQFIIYSETQLRLMAEQGDTLDGPFLYAGMVTATCAFFTFFWRKKGQTPGMQAWRICIINDNSKALSYCQIAVRCLIAIPSILLCLAGVLWIKVDPEQRSWSDRLSKSRTILLVSSSAT